MTRTDVAIMAVGLVVFAALALATIGNSSVWFDESFSAYIIQFNVAEIFQYTAADVHPPLYYWLLKLWSMLFGTTDIALRSMSVLFAGVAMIFGYLTVHRLFGRRAAVFAMGAMIISPFIIRYSQEMRMYTMVAAIALAATYVLVRATETGRRRLWVVYGVLVSLGMWTHYFAAIVWLAHWVWRWTLVRRMAATQKVKQQLRLFFARDWLVAHYVAVGLYLAWLPFLVAQLVTVQTFGFWIPPVTPVTVTNYFTNVLLYLDQGALNPWYTVGFMVVVTIMIWLAVRVKRQLTPAARSGYSLLAAMAFIPVILLIVGSLPPLQSSFVDRYLVASAFALSMLVGVLLSYAGVVTGSRLRQTLLCVGVAALMGVGIANVYALGNYNKIDRNASGAKQMMTQVYAHSTEGEAVVTDTVWMYYDAVFYATDQHQVLFRNSTLTDNYGSLTMLYAQDRNKIMNFDEFLANRDTFWLVGQPGTDDLVPPADNLRQITSLRQADPITGKPVYQAIRYQVQR